MLYVIVLVITLAGVFHASWWAALFGACSLTLYLFWIDHDQDVAAAEPSWVPAQTLTSLVVGAAAGPLAFASGRFAGVVWGV